MEGWMRKLNKLAQAMICLTLLLLIAPGFCLAAETITINGSGSALDMLKPLIAAFHKTNKDVRIIVEKPLGSSGGIKALLAGALDIAMSSRPLKPEELSKGAQLQQYGKTPLVIITGKKVRAKNFTTQELEDIYSGKTTSWPDGETIRLILRPQEDIDSKILGALSPGMAAALNVARSRPGMITAVTDPEASAAVIKTPGGVGATGMTSIIVEKLPVVSLSLNGVAASPQTLASGAYPLAKEISIVTTPKTSPSAQKLISFMNSPQGRTIAAKNGVLVAPGAAAHR
jgi:phosphate transport system substrate-binding protein